MQRSSTQPASEPAAIAAVGSAYGAPARHTAGERRCVLRYAVLPVAGSLLAAVVAGVIWLAPAGGGAAQDPQVVLQLGGDQRLQRGRDCLASGHWCEWTREAEAGTPTAGTEAAQRADSSGYWLARLMSTN